MKLFLIICLGLVSWNAFAGRESHGFLPATFECAPPQESQSIYRASLRVEDKIVVSGILTAQEQALAELPCVDSWPTRNLGDNLEPTVFCGKPRESEFFLELQESNTQSQLKIWKIEPDQKAQLLDTLPCQ